MASALLALATIDQVINEGNKLIQTSTTIEKDIIPYHCSIAPSYNKTKLSESVKMMDDELKIMIAGTNNVLSKLIEEAKARNELLGWDEIIGSMQNNPLIEPASAAIERSDKLIKEGDDFFKFDGSPSSTTVNEVKTWFTSLIKDTEVLEETRIDIVTMANIVAQTGATITDVATLFFKNEYHEKQVMDIGVLRFPDIDNPHFQVYRIQLTAWSDCTRVLFVEHNANGITGVYTTRQYKPRSSVIQGMNPDVKKKAIKEAEDIFS